MDSRLTLEAVEALVAEQRRQAETHRLARSARAQERRSVMTIRRQLESGRRQGSRRFFPGRLHRRAAER